MISFTDENGKLLLSENGGHLPKEFFSPKFSGEESWADQAKLKKEAKISWHKYLAEYNLYLADKIENEDPILDQKITKAQEKLLALLEKKHGKEKAIEILNGLK